MAETEDEIQRALNVVRGKISHVSCEHWEVDKHGNYIVFAYPPGKDSQKWEVTAAQMAKIKEYLRTGIRPIGGLEPRLLGQKRKEYKPDKSGGYKR